MPQWSVFAVMPMPDRLSILDTMSKESTDVPIGSSLALAAQPFSTDSAYALFLTDTDTLSAFAVRGPVGRGRIDIKTKVSRFSPLAGGRLFLLHDAVMGSAVASVVDIKEPAALTEKDRGLNPSPTGFWLISPDASKVLYVKGSGIYMTTLP